MLSNVIRKLLARHKKTEQETIRLKGATAQIRKQLQASFGVSTLEEAQALLKAKKEQHAATALSITKEIERVNRLFGEDLENPESDGG